MKWKSGIAKDYPLAYDLWQYYMDGKYYMIKHDHPVGVNADQVLGNLFEFFDGQGLYGSVNPRVPLMESKGVKPFQYKINEHIHEEGYLLRSEAHDALFVKSFSLLEEKLQKT